MTKPEASQRDLEHPSGEVMNARLRRLCDEMPGMAIHGHLADGAVIYWNRAAETLFGFSAAEAIGRRLLDLIIPPTLRTPFEHTVSTMIASGRGAPAARQMLQHKHGHPVTVRTTYAVVEVPGHPPVLFCTHADMTELALAEGALREREEHWRAAVAEQARLLRQAKNEVDEANQSKSSFLAAAGHDLRQPLYALSLYAEALRARLGPDGATLAADIRDCIGDLSDLLTDVVDLSKLQAGVVIPNLGAVEVAPLLRKVAVSHAPDALRKGLALRTRPTRLTAHTDPVLLNRIVDNLVANAVRFTRHGGILIACRRHQGKDWLEVWDTGSGIPEHKQQEIFNEFVHFENDDQSMEKGSGLGLSIVARTADLLGLRLRIRSRVARGSMFAIELPCGTDTALDLPSAGKEVRAVRIGVVDDNIAALRALSSALTRLGHEVVAARSGPELLARLDPSEPPQAVIIDGRASAYDLIATLRAALGDDLGAIIVTADTDPQTIGEMAARNINVLHKPLELGALQATIGRLRIKPAP